MEFRRWWVLKNNMLKGSHCTLRIRVAPVHQKLGMIIENKVVQELKLEKYLFGGKHTGYMTVEYGNTGCGVFKRGLQN
jgi:hypothetical protein